MRSEFAAKYENNQIVFAHKGEVKLFLSRFKPGRELVITIEEKGNRRTALQNNALHLYFQLLADELNGVGLDMKKVLKQEVDIDWNVESVKEYLWRPIQKALLGKISTTQLKTDEIDKVYDHLNRYLGEKFGVESIPFPNMESIILNL